MRATGRALLSFLLTPLLLPLLAPLLALCIDVFPMSASAQSVAPDNARSAIDAAVADSQRPEADRARDAARKPADCLAFAGLKVGDHVVELLPGGGYFTRIFSVAVGATGQVFAVAQPKSPSAAADAPEPAARVQAIAADAHYGNVSVVVQRLSQPDLPRPVDLVWTSQNYHDLHNVPDLDIAAFNKAVFDALKPGGTYIVLDHAAQAGSGARDTKTLHRIDADAVKKEVLAAGFELVAQSDLLRNPADPHTSAVFDPSIRGKTDQFLIKFRRPAEAARR
jgi:predicted methyltransferase